MTKKLYDIKHGYDCYHAYGGYHYTDYESWDDFIKHWPNEIDHLNTIVRWDWHTQEDDNERHELVLLNFQQRRGVLQVLTIQVSVDDEPHIRKWLKPRQEYLKSLWLGL